MSSSPDESQQRLDRERARDALEASLIERIEGPPAVEYPPEFWEAMKERIRRRGEERRRNAAAARDTERGRPNRFKTRAELEAFLLTRLDDGNAVDVDAADFQRVRDEFLRQMAERSSPEDGPRGTPPTDSNE